MRFGVLGPLEVRTTAGTPVSVGEPKVRALLADLVVHAGRPVAVDRLLDDLWGEDLPGRPGPALQTKVWQLRRTLEAAEPGARELVVSRAPGYLLATARDAVDALLFEDLCAQARGTADPQARTALLGRALGLWRGAAYADFADAEFARSASRRLEELRLVALEELAEARLGLGEHHVLAGELADLAAEHPLRERLHATYIRALYRAGRQSEALERYAALRERLADELGVDPGPGLAALYQAILEQDPALDAPQVPAPAAPMSPAAAPAPAPVREPGAASLPETAARTAPPRARGNLPAPLTGLVGRSADRAAVRSLVAPAAPDADADAEGSAARLVTLTGPGGVGKTRLALAAAGDAADAFPDGTWLVELAGLDRSARAGAQVPAADIATAVAAALGMRDDTRTRASRTPSSADPMDGLVTALQDKQILIVLDNCEHVVDPVADLAALLLGRVPGLHLLATSQEPLGIDGELVYAVGALALPEADVRDLAELGRSDAVRLFLARAAAAAPGFRLDAADVSAVAAICRRLDGLPLALELAATRVRVLGVRDLAERLDDRFRVLAAGRRNAPARQQTLRSIIDWSWELLGEPERVVLRRLATQAEGCTLDAAERICGGVLATEAPAAGDTGSAAPGTGVPEADVLDLLARLVDRSLVVAAEPAPGAGIRYRLLESVAAYCLERLDEAGETAAVWRRHTAYYTELAETAAPHLRDHTQRQWLERLDTETANLRNALEAAARHGDATSALRLATGLGWYWLLRGRLGEARRSLDAALAVPDTGAAPELRAMTVVWRAAYALHSGAPDGLVLAEHAVTVAESIASPRDQANALWLLAFTLYGSGDLDGNHERVGRALALFETLDDRWGTAASLSVLAGHAFIRGDLPLATRQATASLRIFRELGDRWGQLRVGETLAMVAEITEDYEGAAREYRDGLRMAEELGLWTDASYKWSGLGRIALLTHDYANADILHERGRLLAVEHAHKRGEQFAEIGLALSARRQGRLDDAEAHLLKWLDWLRDVYGELGIALVMAELGFIAEQRGDAGEARRLQREGYDAARATGDPRSLALALEGLAGAEALAGGYAHAARLLGSAAAARESVGVPLAKAESGDLDRITAAAQAALGKTEFDRLLASGRAESPDGIVRELPFG
ncbi:BTAD domain-containing putative transcriptional regulator [Yinghuangia soli]|uniref:Winged helix-turn-helix domain-containing protein n=1 Tax=Yinghuangia soli TaxID=2908204 RepID=A0AA41Q1L8_9ACTN|nr:BTAD domain-containing putative transcriptional regulator [Yinghuangia soli]MCF2529280.1 winged helix-turn-helix domain-containing protein [Yinghuangia soli]